VIGDSTLSQSLVSNLQSLLETQKSSAGTAELFAGRGEKGGLFVLLDDDVMIAGMTGVVAQAGYKPGVIYFTVCQQRQIGA
jgi:hypothetical protein